MIIANMLIDKNKVGSSSLQVYKQDYKLLRKYLIREQVFDKRAQHAIPTSELTRMADFFLKNNYFEFNGQIK